MAKDKVLLGHIAGAHGIKGDVLIKTYTGAPGDIGAYGPLSNADGTRSFALRVRRVSQNGVIAAIQGIADRTAAETLKGTELYVTRERLPQPEEGEFYHADLTGLAAVDVNGTAIGTVVAVRNYGAGDLLEIALAGTRETDLIPFTAACVPEVHVSEGRIVVRRPKIADTGEEPGTG